MGAALASLSPSKLARHRHFLLSGKTITAREKRLRIAASRQKRLQPHAHDDEASEDEHGGDADCEAHCVDAAKSPWYFSSASRRAMAASAIEQNLPRNNVFLFSPS